MAADAQQRPISSYWCNKRYTVLHVRRRRCCPCCRRQQRLLLPSPHVLLVSTWWHLTASHILALSRPQPTPLSRAHHCTHPARGSPVVEGALSWHSCAAALAAQLCCSTCLCPSPAHQATSPQVTGHPVLQPSPIVHQPSPPGSQPQVTGHPVGAPINCASARPALQSVPMSQDPHLVPAQLRYSPA
jgi:hypothetical protein